MDTSKEYIEMCRKATEIRTRWKLKIGDFVYDAEAEDSMIIINYHPSTYIYVFELTNNYDFESNILHYNDMRDLLWLPRQDQLQGMLGKNALFLVDFFDTFCVEYCYDARDGHFFVKEEWKDASMEQLWLAFVMHELHSKKWGGKRWK